MSKISVLGIDLAKNVFQLHGVDEKGKIILQRKLSRNKLAEFICTIPPCLIGMEACGGAHYWARKFENFGHEVRLMSPQYVKPYVKTNKNDMNDAEAICEAVTRPSMRFVPIKTIEQQDIQAVHRIRSRLMAQRTGLVNQVRGLLAEYGLVMAQGISRFRTLVPTLLEDDCSYLTSMAKSLFWNLYEQFKYLDEQINLYDHKIKQLCQESEICQRLLQVDGVGPLTASALIAAVGDGKVFNKARQLSAFLGLVPRQSSSGGKNVLLGIRKRECLFKNITGSWRKIRRYACFLKKN